MAGRGWALTAGVALMFTAGMATAAVVQEGNLRLTVLSQVKPFKLPRRGTAPIAVLTIDVNR